jgi:hypothetical protein
MKLDEIQKTKETLTNTLLTLNISPLVSDKISPRVVPENRSSLNHNILKHHPSYEEVMCKILDENFWTILTKEVNDTIVKLDSKNAKKYFKKKLTISDVKHLVGIHYKLDWVSTETLKERFEKLREKVGYDKTGKKKGSLRFHLDNFILFNANFQVENLNLIVDPLNKNFKSLVDVCYVLAADELTSGYQPSKETKKKAEMQGQEIPVKYVPRKPRPNCFWIDAVATRLKPTTDEKNTLTFYILCHSMNNHKKSHLKLFKL